MKSRYLKPFILRAVALSTLTNLFAGANFGAFPKEFIFKKMNVYWTDSAPKLDGKMDETCWKDAEVGDKFSLHDTEPIHHATQQTEVRVCYDADYLYLFYTCFDDQMDKVSLGQPEDYRDGPVHRDDSIELFLDPNRQQKKTFHFSTNARGARWEAFAWYALAWRYNPDWKLVVDIQQDRWNVEMKIPFSGITYGKEHPYMGTPTKGDIWGIAFCRNQKRLREWSHWSATACGFDRANQFGSIIFQGRKNGPAIPVIKAIETPALNFGEGRFVYSINPYQNVVCEYQLVNDGKTVSGKKLTGEANLDIPWNVKEGGEWNFTVSFNIDGKKVYSGYSHMKLPLVGKTLQKIATQLDTVEKMAKNNKKLDFLVKNTLKTRQKQLALSKKLKTNASFDGNEWKKMIQDVDELQKQAQSLGFDVYRMKLLEKLNDIPAFTVVVADPFTKIREQTELKVVCDPQIELSAAGNEYESYQIAIIPFWKELKDVQVSFSDLTPEPGRVPEPRNGYAADNQECSTYNGNKNSGISAKNLSYQLVDYVKISEGILKASKTAHEWEPDILCPGKPFSVLPNANRVVWIDVFCPPKTPAGIFRGEITLKAANETVKIPITLNAYGFDIPANATLKNNHWFNPPKVAKFNRLHDNAYTFDVFKKHTKLGKKYRCTMIPNEAGFMYRLLPVYREKDGSLTYDFSTWEKWLTTAFENGSNMISASFGCNIGALIAFRQTYLKITDRETGKKLTFKELYPKVYEAFKNAKSEREHWEIIFTHPGYQQFMAQWTEFLKKKGWINNCYYEVRDESTPAQIVHCHRALRKLAPEMPLLSYGSNPKRRIHRTGETGYIDIWGPNLKEPEIIETFEAIKERKSKYGERCAFYVCDGFDYGAPYASTRILPWAAFRHDAEHFLFFCMTGKRAPKTQEEKRYPDALWIADQGYQLFYYGPNMQLWPSIRVSSLRDGMEEYEYLTLLRDRCRYLDPQLPEHKALLDEAETLLDLNELLGKNYAKWQYQLDPQKFAKRKQNVAKTITKIDKAIASYQQH